MQTEGPTIPARAVAVEGAPQAAGTRVHYVDWLRALAVLGVFVYHSLRPFSTHDWHVKNDRLSGGIEALISFVDPWGIAFFFLIAGASSFLALRWRTPRQYVGERLLRLLVPLVVAYLLLSPVQAFIEERHFGRYAGSFLAGVPVFFREVWSNLPETLPHPLLVDRTYHLWFVVFLLWFSLLGLPVLLWLRGPGGRRLSAWLGERAGRRGSTLVLAVPLAVLPLAILPLWPDAEDWGSFAYLFGFFIAGYLLMSDPRVMKAVRRDVVIALAAAIVVDALILLSGVPGFLEGWQDAPSYSWMYVWAYFRDRRAGLGLGPVPARARDACALVPPTVAAPCRRGGDAVLLGPSAGDPGDRVLRRSVGRRDLGEVGCDRARLVRRDGGARDRACPASGPVDDVRGQAARFPLARGESLASSGVTWVLTT